VVVKDKGMMRTALLILPCACVALATALATAAAQSPAASDNANPIPGYYDVETHTFTPAPLSRLGAAPAAAPILRKGKIVIKATLKISASVAKTEAIAAFGSAAVANKTSSYSSTLGRVPIKRSGNVGTVTLSLPYLFAVDSKSETLKVQFQAIPATGQPTLSLSQEIALPADGATTTLTFTGSL
jgi:hypothetical protein